MELSSKVLVNSVFDSLLYNSIFFIFISKINYKIYSILAKDEEDAYNKLSLTINQSSINEFHIHKINFLSKFIYTSINLISKYEFKAPNREEADKILCNSLPKYKRPLVSIHIILRCGYCFWNPYINSFQYCDNCWKNGKCFVCNKEFKQLSREVKYFCVHSPSDSLYELLKDKIDSLFCVEEVNIKNNLY